MLARVGYVDAGCPAHAGIDPCGAEEFAAACRLPRTRGDRPPVMSHPQRPDRLPRTRGDRPEYGWHGGDAHTVAPHTRG